MRVVGFRQAQDNLCVHGLYCREVAGVVCGIGCAIEELNQETGCAEQSSASPNRCGVDMAATLLLSPV